MQSLGAARILIIATDGFERSELVAPRDLLRAAGAKVHVASPDGAAIRSWDKSDWGEHEDVDIGIENADSNQYDAIIVPGGQITPDILRTKPEAVQIVTAFHERGKTVAAICHGPWLLVEADVVIGRKPSAAPSIGNAFRNLGTTVAHEETAMQPRIITSRSPGDLEGFIARISESIAQQHPNHDKVWTMPERPSPTRPVPMPG